MKKAPEAFRTISEVADLLDTPAHVLRFWESKFYQIRPVKRAGGRRYYRPDDVALINGIKTLLQDRGMTIRGAQRILQEQGIKVVAQMGLPLPHGGAMLRVVGGTDGPDEAMADAPDSDAWLPDDDEPEGSDLPDVQPQDELTMEMQPSPRYAWPVAGGEETPVSDPAQAAGKQPEGEGAPVAPEHAPVEEVAMSSDDLLTPLQDPAVETANPPPDLLAAMLRPRAMPAEAPPPPEAPEMPERIRLAKALRGLPRSGPGVQRDRLTVLARRIDALLERMSEASGAGRW